MPFCGTVTENSFLETACFEIGSIENSFIQPRFIHYSFCLTA